mgnify:CR=1 FL=1
MTDTTGDLARLAFVSHRAGRDTINVIPSEAVATCSPRNCRAVR